MPDPRGLGGPEHDDVGFDRHAHPALSGFFDALDGLAEPPADPDVRLTHIARAASTAAEQGPAHRAGHGWTWRAVGLRAVAAAAALAVVVAGLGADDRLPSPAQRVVSSIAERVGLDLPDGSEDAGDARPSPADDDVRPGSTTGRGSGGGEGTTGGPGRDAPVTPGTTEHDELDDPARTTPDPPERSDRSADPAVPAAPADPATPATPGSADSPAVPATPADPADPASPANPTSPANPETPETPDPVGPGEHRRPEPPAPPAPVEPEQRTTPTTPEHRVEPQAGDTPGSAGTDARSGEIPARP